MEEAEEPCHRARVQWSLCQIGFAASTCSKQNSVGTGTITETPKSSMSLLPNTLQKVNKNCVYN